MKKSNNIFSFIHKYFVQSIRLLQEIYMLEYGKFQQSRRKQKPNRINEADTLDEEPGEKDPNDENQDIIDVEMLVFCNTLVF